MCVCNCQSQLSIVIYREDSVGLAFRDTITQPWQGPVFPNRTAYNCPSLNCNEGCLFNVFNDPHEINDVASANPDIVAELKAEIKRQNASVFSPWRGVEDDLACKVAMGKNKGFWGPFLD